MKFKQKKNSTNCLFILSLGWELKTYPDAFILKFNKNSDFFPTLALKTIDVDSLFRLFFFLNKELKIANEINRSSYGIVVQRTKNMNRDVRE